MVKTKPTMPTIDEIGKLRKQLEGFYSELHREQKEDQLYYDDLFPTSIKKPYRVVRIATAAKIVDTATSHITTSNPQAFREPRKKTDIEINRAIAVSKLLNHWLPLLIDEVEESVKNTVSRGEAFVQIEYNANFDPNDDTSLPIAITVPDPMIIFADPYERGGIPRRIIKYCHMAVGQVEQLYPEWSNPKGKKPNSSVGVEYLAYWDANWRYFEADGEALLPGGIQRNIFGFVPFVHCYSGFGKSSPEGKPESKIVGILRKKRGQLVEQCEVKSQIYSQIALFTNPVVNVEQTDPQATNPPDKDDISFAPGAVNIIPLGWKVDVYQASIPTPQMFQYAFQIDAALGVEIPPIAMGIASTSRATGRQEDIYLESYGAKYQKLAGNIARMWSTALSMGLRILDTVPGILPITVRATVLEDGKNVNKEEEITKKDIDGYYACKVELNPERAIEQDRNAQLFRMLANEGRVSWKTLLTKGLGYTEEQAEEEINEATAEQAIRMFLPHVIAEEAMRKAGMGKYLKLLEEQTRLEQKAVGTSPLAPRIGATETPTARETVRQMLQESPVGIRRSPEVEGLE